MKNEDLSTDTFFTFKLGLGTFAMPVTCVKEVLNYEPWTIVPNSKSYMKGVMNIRGSIIAVVDFRELFEFEGDGDYTATSMIVSEIPQNGEPPLVIAIVADGVNGVGALNFIKAENVSYGMMEKRKEFIKAVAEQDGNFIMLLDMHKIISSIETEISQATAL